MKNIIFSSFLIFCLLGIANCQFQGNLMLYFCIAQNNAPSDKLQAFMNMACGVVDCSAIQPGGPCFDPNTIQNHANYALHLYYRKTGKCDKDLGIPTPNNPSYGNCVYPPAVGA